MKRHKRIVTMLGVGYVPYAPGTAGSIVGVVLLFITNSLLIKLGFGTTAVLFINLALTILVFLIGSYSIKKIQTKWEYDDSKIVIDEVIGVWIAALALPLRLEYYLVALLLFRVFDIVKPLFIKKIDAIKSHWSVMLDDVLAGIYARVVIQFILFFNLF
ncbi:MAG: phosphatidylglycerophosphatase A [Bacteroidales bacterium]|nr:phosphatidylglycerophosphatase A [Bacteroidales bacterium]MDD3700746.1 phosphatidylglycerophosphatase A [Bacteroidales bacterium]MDY0369362.1 phosphatidylglycerophosphatase A [Bacteroidales bacterium]